MSKYPIKMLSDEQGTPFVPLVTPDSIYTTDDEGFEQVIGKKLEADNLIEGEYITIEKDGNDCTISAELPVGLTVINNLTTAGSGYGVLDAYQGKVLKDSIPTIVDNLESDDANKVLSANQGRVLDSKTVPEGGKTGQVLKKSSDDNHELEWGDAADPNAIVGDGTIMSIVELSYADYKALEAAGELKEDTEYHIIDVENGTATYMTEEQIQEMIDESIRTDDEIQTLIEENIVNNLTTTSATKALSATMGKTLNANITTVSNTLSNVGDVQESAFSNIVVTERTTLTTLTLPAGIWVITAHCQYQTHNLHWYLSIANTEIQMGAYDNSGWIDGQITGIITPTASTTYTLSAWTMDANGNVVETTCSTGYLKAVRIK